MNSTSVSPDLLKRLEPLASLSPDGARELSRLCQVETVAPGLDPFPPKSSKDQSVYLLKGKLKVRYAGERTEVLVGGTEEARRALGKQGEAIRDARALTEVDLLRIDDEALDIMLTWDQVLAVHKASAEEAGEGPGNVAEWSTLSGLHAGRGVACGVFAALPPAHIDELLKRFERVRVLRGQDIVREGGEGDYYYVIESGRCSVTRHSGPDRVHLADLGPGDAFGEEALVSDTTRNATVAMKSDGVLLRLAKADFVELLKEPLLHKLTLDEARAHMSEGAKWLDVRLPSEYAENALPGAINIPLNEIRRHIGSLDASNTYIVYCQSGRRSSAAAFLLSQRGYRAFWLDGGLRGL